MFKHVSLAVLVGLGLSPVAAQATIVVTNNTNALALANALIAGNTGITVTNATLSGQTSGAAASSGIYNLAGSNAYNLSTSPGIVLSTGNAAAYGSGPNTSPNTTTAYGTAGTAAQEALLDPITGNFNHFDVTRLTITFDAGAGVSQIFFNGVFGSEEYAEYVGTSFVDGFGLYLNGTNIAFANGNPVNINSPDFKVVAETQLDGVLAPNNNPLLTFTGSVGMGSTGNVLDIIIADSSDANYDSTVYLSSLGSVNVAATPEPSTITLVAMGLPIGLGYWLRRRGRATT